MVEREECLNSFLRSASDRGFMLPDAVRSIWEGKRDTSALCKHVDPVSAGIIRFIVLLVNNMEEKCPADTSEMLPDLFDALDHIKRFEPREMRRLFKGKSERAIPCAGGPFSSRG